MGSLLTPPGHPAYALALITSKFGGLQIAVAPPDADVQVGFVTANQYCSLMHQCRP
jgi:hypothetical protein